MANERITEAFVRDHFKNYSNAIHLEEQQSKIPKIEKLLQNASKKGLGVGRPEFIVTYIEDSKLLTVVECKADVKKHESKTKDKFSDFAVDGVLLYASYLSKEYDVLAIAVSGEDEKHAKVSHFLQLQNEKTAVPIFGSELLSAKDYLQGYLKSEEKFRQDYNALLDFSRKLNETLHSHKILESQRSLLISCILIALEDKAFKKAYQDYYHPHELANHLVDTVVNNLRRANIEHTKLNNLNIEFSFIRTDTSLSTKRGVLKQLIEDIDLNINSFIRNHEYYDVLGQLYIEFLRYANSDKGLGIVLTPPHITELFSDLAEVDKNSIVYDNCTGTGGFLISAMSRMIKDAKGDQAAEMNIRERQLLGVEFQAHIFALACSNMFIHQDGKTNIINGDCFDQSIIDAVKARKPTVGFLNPPYKANKKTDTEELAFVLNNLECLQSGGTCITILPMQSALAQSGKVYELKKELLEKHTLEAVLSMPDELFVNSNVGVVSCIMIFTAHKPHPKNKKTYFGYYKDDGFVKRKNKGRIDAFGKWKEIKDKWITSYRNKDIEVGFSIKTIVTADDEWCAEAYMETDYSRLTEKDFAKYLKDYILFKIKED
ncbi:MAG TPA: N-6 DNA methylase [Pyrinomonadaceae bacterium]|jgi:type I restriction-modification system DNA methylase subunit